MPTMAAVAAPNMAVLFFPHGKLFVDVDILIDVSVSVGR
jgi:hypothetical protein